jgi:RHS repeat-associated protein
VTHLTSAAGAIVEKYKYDAFGAVKILAPNNAERSASAYGNRFLFTGREYAATFEFYEYRARAYNPVLGRFMSEDPKGFDAGDYNLFRYCHNDPLDLTDPTGLGDEQVNAQMVKVGYVQPVMHVGSNIPVPKFVPVATLRLDAAQVDGKAQGGGNIGQAGLQRETKRAQELKETFYGTELIRRFDQAIAGVMKMYALQVPPQTAQNAPFLNRTFTSKQLYAIALSHGGRAVQTQAVAGFSDPFKGPNGTIYMSKNTQINPFRIYAHELANTLDARMFGSQRTFGHVPNELNNDPDTGATVELSMFGSR